MSSPPTDRKSLKVTVFLRDGTKTELTEDVSNGGGDAVDLKLMSKAVETLQTRTNAELTRLVELEKQSGAASDKNNTNGIAEDAEEDDEEEDDDDDDDDENNDGDDGEPPQKQQKR